MPETKYQRLIRLLKEMFQLGDAAELDFGIYRIMHARKAEIEKFLEKDLFQKHVKEALAGEAGGQRAKIEAEIAELERTLKAAGVDPASAPKYKELVAKRDAEPDHSALEDEVYGHLLTFFGRYYQEGDFISQRRYGENAYAIPYNGEEVKLYWANHDQYYIKSGEDLKHYAFLIGGKRVRFKLVAATTERDNAKEQKGKERYHIFAREGHAISEENGELVVPFEYRLVTREEIAEHAPEVGARPNMRDELSALSAKWILEDAKLPAAWKPLLTAAHKTDGEATGKSVIEHHVRRYMAKATFDYFIHKDLGGFLRRELDWFIKHELMHLADILDEKQTAEQLGRRHFAKLRVLRAIADKLIEFLAQLEDFQKKLWLKKKFVLETHYLIRMGIIPEKFYPEIAANDVQREEWVNLFNIDAIKKTVHQLGYTKPIAPNFLKQNAALLLDTRFFDRTFTLRLLEELGGLSDETDGTLIHGDNAHVLRLLKSGLHQAIDCTYIDPPYNTGDSEIPYKNTYLHSSWLTLMGSRLQELSGLLAPDGVVFIAIDDFEMVNLSSLVDSSLPSFRREMIIVNHHPQGGKATAMAHTHEYMIACVSNHSDRTLTGRSSSEGVEERPFKRSGTAESNFRYGRSNSFYALLVDRKALRVVGIEPPPNTNQSYPTADTLEGYARVYPIGEGGEERVWRRSYESAVPMVAANKFKVSSNLVIYQLIEMHERTSALFSNWVDPRYNAGTNGANLLRDILGSPNIFSYPKSVFTVEDALYSVGLDENACVLDFFGGSGTTGHAVINLNRGDGEQRKFIIAEMGAHFETALLPRLKKISYSPEWKEGKPVRFADPEETERSPRIMKVLRLESYEDACDNILFDRTKGQQEAFDKLPDAEREKYRLQYMLNVETRGSASLLNIQKFNRPFEYTLRVTRDDVTREQTVDLVETFNWLLGLRVETIRLSKDSTFKATDHGILEVTGKDPQGNRCLVIWRNTDEVPDEKLLKWFEKNRYKVKDFEWDMIYVNGDNTLENLKRDDQTWTVRLIEQEFHRLMFEGCE